MTTGFKALNGQDLDSLYELAPSEAYSIYGSIVGTTIDVDSSVSSVSAGQFMTTNGVADLLKRYLWHEYGTNRASTFDGYVFRVTGFDQSNNSSLPEDLYLNRYGANIGSSGGVPTWSTSMSSSTKPTLYMSTNPQEKSFTISGSAQTGGFPITGYSIVSHTVTVTGSSGSIQHSMISGYPRTNSGGCDVKFSFFGDMSGRLDLEVDVIMKAHNEAGSSANRTYRFLISADYSTGGKGGGFGGGDF